MIDIQQQIQDNIRKIAELQATNSTLQSIIDKAELEHWEPEDGNYFVDCAGEVSEREFNYLENQEPREFGIVRTSNKQAKWAAANMRRFNRLSCFMDDSKPILEFTDISVGLVFYDYDEQKLEKLKAIIQAKGDL